MQYLFGLLCVCALGVMGCADASGPGGTGGAGGSAGTGGVAGTGGAGGSAGTGGVAGTGGGGGVAGTGGSDGGPEFPCSEAGIRAAIALGGGPHTFDCDGLNPVMTGEEILINNDVILNGEGKLTVDGQTRHRVFSVGTNITAELRGFTVSGGNAKLSRGGGIDNYGTLTLTNSTVSGNTATYSNGGGIYNRDSGQLTLTNSTVSDNTGEFGGGIYNAREATLTVTNSTVSGNTAEYFGGWGGWGGGIYNYGTLTVTNSTVSGNTADLGGSGIRNGGDLTLTNSTVADNTVSDDTGEFGGSIYNAQQATLTNSLVDGDCKGRTVTSNGYNIESPLDTCGFGQTGDQPGVTEAQLNLGELAANGGLTMTHKPGDGGFGEGSAAIDKIPAVDCEVDKDQRGQPRPETGGMMCDVGAFEVQP